MRLILIFLATTFLMLNFSQRASPQENDKAVMLVQNYRNESITMNFLYVLGDYSWSLMEREIPIDGNITTIFQLGYQDVSIWPIGISVTHA